MTATVAGWIAYAALRGDVVADNAASAAALVRAGDYIRTRYVLRFSADYDDTAPQVEEATYIAAKYELATPGFWATTYTPATAKVLTEVKGIKWTPIAAQGAVPGADGMLPVSPAIDALLVPLTRWGMPAVMVV